MLSSKMTLSYTILCLCIILPFITANTYKCQPPNKDLVKKLENQYGLDISDVEQVFTYDYRDSFIDSSTRNPKALFLGHVKVNFTGHLLPIGKKSGFLTKESFDTNTVVVHHKVENTKARCEINEADFLKTRATSNRTFQVIHNLTTACLEEFVCGEWGRFITNDFLIKQKLEATVNEIFKDYAKSKHVGRIPTTTTTTEAPFDGHYDPQSTWNSIFDIGKAVAINQMVGMNKGILVLPEMKFNFTKLGSTGDILLKNITIDGLTSLERTKDILVNRYKQRYEISTGMRVKNLKIKVPYYKGRYGKIEIDGIIGANISELSISLKASVDYNSNPCQIQVNELHKDILDDPKTEFTGLSILNWPIKKFAEYFIRNNLFDMVEKIAAAKINELNCERFRFAIESVKL